jgi:hypothetical protein
LRICGREPGGDRVNRAAASLEAVTASFCKLLADVRDKLAEMRANRDELLPGRDQRRSRTERILMDRRKSGSGIALHRPPCCAPGQCRGDGVIGSISKDDANHLPALDGAER